MALRELPQPGLYGSLSDELLNFTGVWYRAPTSLTFRCSGNGGAIETRPVATEGALKRAASSALSAATSDLGRHPADCLSLGDLVERREVFRIGLAERRNASHLRQRAVLRGHDQEHDLLDDLLQVALGGRNLALGELPAVSDSVSSTPPGARSAQNPSAF